MGKKRQQHTWGEGSRKKQNKKEPTVGPPQGEGSRKKQNKKVSTSQGEGSRKKQNKKVSTSRSPPPLSHISYDKMPMNHKKKWFIDDDVGGSLSKYVEIITWLRVMGSFDGSVFEDIPNLNCSEEAYPLLEVEVVTPQQTSVKFVIVKSSLYLIACIVNQVKFQFNCEFKIDTFNLLEDYNGKYTSQPWNQVGPRNMIEAINELVGMDNNIEMRDAIVMKPYVEACEVFFVHLCEAARLYVVESIVCKTLEPHSTTQGFENRTYVKEEEKLFFQGKDDKKVDKTQDVYSLVKGDGPINFNRSDKTDAHIKNFIHSYKQMSKVWFTYSLSGRKHFKMSYDSVSKLNMRSVKSLRCSLGVLCNTNLEKILEEWKKKSKNNHPTITVAVYEEMEKQVHDLQAQKKVLNS